MTRAGLFASFFMDILVAFDHISNGCRRTWVVLYGACVLYARITTFHAQYLVEQKHRSILPQIDVNREDVVSPLEDCRC